MESLTLDNALKLYEILGAHIPETKDKDITAWDFIGRIVKDINSSEDHAAYTLSIELMSGKTLQDLQEMSSESRLELFTECLIQNKILVLVSFCKNIGFNYG